MQTILFPELAAPIREIDRCLRRWHGPLSPVDRLDPVSQLVLSLIGTRTRGGVSVDVFQKMRKHFQNWEALLRIPEVALAYYIDAVTYPEQKAAQLQRALWIIQAWCGSLELSFLCCWPVEDAQFRLRWLPGVDAKVSAAVLNFSTLQKRILVVDCHHIRVAKRVGLLGPKTPFPAAYRILMDQHIPNDWTAEDLDDHHRLMKLLGQLVCKHDQPRCSRCPLQDICATGRQGSVLEDDSGLDEDGCDERIIASPLPA
jgi:endonuclease-3